MDSITLPSGSKRCVFSVAFKESAAYWVGASDDISEGDFRWTNGFPYTYSNWFPGWTEHNHYNKQPNDDGDDTTAAAAESLTDQSN